MQNPETQLSQLSLEEKARLCVGMNFWMTRDYPQYAIPSLFLSDGPHGLRKQDVEKSDHLGINESHPSVCYPTASAAACTWDRDLLRRMGRALGREAAQSGVDMLLGPGINIKRSPLCGRNFEYYSEDPCCTAWPESWPRPWSRAFNPPRWPPASSILPPTARKTAARP